MKKTLFLLTIGILLGSTAAFATTKFFSDVPEDTWYTEAVTNLSEKGIVQGYSDGTFGPSKNVNRAELAVMLNRLIEYVEIGEVSQTPQVSKLRSYENSTLSLGFSYPDDWGNITQDKDGTDHISLRVFDNSTIFFAADNGGESVGRGAYWGDYAEFIDSQSYINNLCITKIKAESCEINTNSYGVKYAKLVEEIPQIMADSTIETQYYIYNPNSEYRGIILSTEFLKRNNIQNLETKLQDLLNSLYFTD